MIRERRAAPQLAGGGVVVSAPLKRRKPSFMEPNQIAPAIVALKERSSALRRYL
jgi:hypothetical protein